MKYSLRFIFPIVILLIVAAFALLPLVDSLTLNWFKKDLNLRSQLIARSINVSVKDMTGSGSVAGIPKLLEEFTADERLLAIGLCNFNDELIYKTLHFPDSINCSQGKSSFNSLEISSGEIYLANYQLDSGYLMIIHDMSFIARRNKAVQYYMIVFFALLTAVISFVTFFVATRSFKSYLRDVRLLFKGDGKFGVKFSNVSLDLKPIAKDLRLLVRDIEKERRVRELINVSWTPEQLREILNKELSGEEILVLSNREPYIHNRNADGSISIQNPASGLVTALEPLVLACSGTWVAHGSGSADKDTVDSNDCIGVPPENPQYKIRRVWLSPEEEQGYYYGFSNEGLWPLCHIAHTRPVFKSSDWKYYVSVNEKFAAAVVAEAKSEKPVILIQDYHFALVPKMIREALPGATIITFWHIPWPNAESFGICPWREEILEGLLGSSILGFHTRFHCNNFFESAERFLECRVDHDISAISFQKKLTVVRDYPISIEWPPRAIEKIATIDDCKKKVFERNNLPPNIKIGVGVDRMDYTKGILERFQAIKRLFEMYPAMIGKFSFIQIAAPTRSSIKEYKFFEEEIRKLAEEINSTYTVGQCIPIILLARHHGPREVFEYYRASDFCFVSSLHDGMNLVAKEYIASRDDENGVLILSQFTGAAKELLDAIVVNPYDFDQCAKSIFEALKMSITEKKDRMRNMRAIVQENNIYLWGGRMLIDAAKFRLRDKRNFL